MYTQNIQSQKNSNTQVITYPNTEAINDMKVLSAKSSHNPEQIPSSILQTNSIQKPEQDENLLILILTLLLTFDSECDNSIYFLIALTFILPNQ